MPSAGPICLLLGEWDCLELLSLQIDEVSAVQIPAGVFSVEIWWKREFFSVEGRLACPGFVWQSLFPGKKRHFR